MSDDDTVYELSNLVALYSLENDLEIRATKDALVSLAKLLLVPNTRSLIIELFEPQLTAQPYFGFVNRVLIQHQPHKVIVSRTGDTLVISGNGKSLLLFAESVKWLATEDSNVSSHLHVVPYPDHPYLELSSCPLVVSVVETS